MPLAQRQALGIAVMSYDGHLGFGLLGDYDALPELDTIALDLKWAIAALARAAGVRRAQDAARHASATPARGATARAWLRGERSLARSRAASAAKPASRRLSVRLALCQLNATVGDIAGNAARIRAGMRAATRGRRRARAVPRARADRLSARGPAAQGALPGRRARSRSSELAAEARGIVAVVGFPERAEDVYNAAAVLADGAVHAIYRKVYLPNYGVFDEQRYFQAGQAGAVHRPRRSSASG